MALKQPQPTLDQLAAMCLDHLAQNPEQLVDFMGSAGLSPDALRHAVGTRSFAMGLLDYVVQNEPLLVAIAAGNAIRPESIMTVWAKANRTE